MSFHNPFTLSDATRYGPSMPTAKEVDNRPVAVGKWPRHHHRRHNPAGFERYPRHPGCGRSKCGADERCAHKYGNISIDVLLRPELLNEIYGERGSDFLL